jgi:hypothetical protein
MRNRTSKHHCTLQITDMLKHGSRFIRYYGITHRLVLHKVTKIAQNYIYDDDASMGVGVTMAKIIVDS